MSEEPDSVTVKEQALPVWPEDQRLRSFDEKKTLLQTDFADAGTVNEGLKARILELGAIARERGHYGKHLGGVKVYGVGEWNCPEAELIDARARHYFKHCMGVESAAVDLSWANIYGPGDYVLPHAHIRSTASVVYMVDEGDPDPEHKANGLFSVIDPRVEMCCRIQPGYMTNPFYPSLKAGSMIIFRSHLLHAVMPYTGARPRITLSWNINIEPQPGDAFEVMGMTKPVYE